MRLNLKQARIKANMTQREVAESLNICLRHYQYLESGRSYGACDIWDRLEDMFGVNQRILRQDQRGSQLTRRKVAPA